MKVWILERGEYSDRHVVGVFSSKERALEAIALRRDTYDNDPEEYEVDGLKLPTAGSDWELGMVHYGYIRTEDGSVSRQKSYGPWMRHPQDCRIETCGDWRKVDSVYCIEVWSPISNEHAAKVAVEKRQEYLRTGKVSGTTERPRRFD